ncbi:MAG: hypothetical protein KAI47_04065 [Deltaproteobacteria bacterium]|nr:hypothetical protein [Deltaproteobacteria bacterium]
MSSEDVSEDPADIRGLDGVVPIEKAGDAARFGGKASGLARLMRLGLGVPPGFVVMGGREAPGLGAAFRELRGAVAVRSSATDEDGSSSSFAGQYATVLNVGDEDALHDAIAHCVASLDAAGPVAYRREREGEATTRGDGSASMSVVVQRMVDARCAGVLFTADPLTGRRDRIVIDAVLGLGEALVSGHAEPEHLVVAPTGEVVSRHLVGPSAILSDDEVARLVAEAKRVAADSGVPMDLEWAIDDAGALHWLQARPITTLGSDPHEFDGGAREGDWITLANIGEMLPGAVCPLDLSTVVVGIEHGIVALISACGVPKSADPRLKIVAVSQGHLFFNLTSMLPFCRDVGGSSEEQVAYAICGRTISDLDGGPRASRLTRAIKGGRYFRYVFRGEAEVRRFMRKARSFAIPRLADGRATYEAIDEALPMLLEVYDVHIQSSAGSGFSAGVLQGIVAKGKIPTAEQEAELARLLAGVEGVESADLVRELGGLGVHLAGAREDFSELSEKDALAWLRSAKAGGVGQAFQDFLRRHGHRAVRELSLQQSGWADDPIPLVCALQAAGRGAARRSGTADGARGQGRGRSGARPSPRRRSRYGAKAAVLAWSQRTVQRRERSKSLLVKVTDVFKRAYRDLAAQLFADRILPEEELIFFLTHAELGELLAGSEGLVSRARSRRQTFRAQERLRFPTLVRGKPVPFDEEAAPGSDVEDEDGEVGRDALALRGQPVSPGVVQGVARIVHHIKDAGAIEPGDILIAPVTDVGWSPYFRIISGLATDVGSAISHGAVVAREYGLPAVVNLRSASQKFRSGDIVRLDANVGILRRVDPGGGEGPE